ncbi:maltose acetyltransferase domain-containing protein [Corynebacterium renale]|uniref:maltose acetyltransferase domain-containing protein n=1 Tax=Corynebacterium renale TaxID=1724 RepID=UPI00069EB7FA|nr:maltose acetyltransferase domain-containing protein [Corynebacterium renale]
MSTQRKPDTPDPNHPNTLDYVASGNWFQPGCSAFQDERARTLDLVHEFNALPPTQQERAQELLRQITCSDTHATVGGPFFVEVGKHLHLGERVFINTGATILNTAHVTIGDGTMIGRTASSSQSRTRLTASSAPRGGSAPNRSLWARMSG